MAKLTKTDLHILNAMIIFYENKIDYNIVIFSQSINVSQAAVTKACQKFGFKGYKEFQCLCRFKNDSCSFNCFLGCVKFKTLIGKNLSSGEFENELKEIVNKIYSGNRTALGNELCENLASVLYFSNICYSNQSNLHEIIQNNIFLKSFY